MAVNKVVRITIYFNTINMQISATNVICEIYAQILFYLFPNFYLGNVHHSQSTFN